MARANRRRRPGVAPALTPGRRDHAGPPARRPPRPPPSRSAACELRRLGVLIADGQKALILEDRGHRAEPRLAAVLVRTDDNPPTREQGTDRPGRHADTGPGHRSAFEETDWHRFEKDRFAAETASLINRAALENRYGRLVICAAPKVLGELRSHLHKVAEARVAAEIAQDLTDTPTAEMAELLAPQLDAAVAR